jgi:hypothetical protein
MLYQTGQTPPTRTNRRASSGGGDPRSGTMRISCTVGVHGQQRRQPGDRGGRAEVPFRPSRPALYRRAGRYVECVQIPVMAGRNGSGHAEQATQLAYHSPGPSPPSHRRCWRKSWRRRRRATLIRSSLPADRPRSLAPLRFADSITTARHARKKLILARDKGYPRLDLSASVSGRSAARGFLDT